jgi:hypothetical protein
MVTGRMQESVIEIKGLDVDGERVSYRFSFDGPVREFLLKDSLYVKTDHPLGSIPSGILVIPLLGFLAPLAWVANCGIVADAVDEAYLDSVSKVRETMQQFYPKLKLHGTIKAKPISSESYWDSNRYCLLYSGGVDSLASYIRNRETRPSLLMIRGTPDVWLSEVEFHKRSIDRLAPALKGLGGDLHLVETDALEIIDYKGLKAHVRNEEIKGWWENFAHGLFLTGMCAPYTCYNHIGRLLIASSSTTRDNTPWGSMPEVDKQISWGGLQVIHDSFDYTKFEKVREVLAPFLKDRKMEGFPLRVCTGDADERLASGRLNCGRCGKCTRTMLMLLENGIDPDKCEFDMTKFFPSRLRIGLENGYIKLKDQPVNWGQILDNARVLPDNLESKYHGTNALFRWMAKWDRQPKESSLRSYSKVVAPIGSRRRRLARRILRK